MNEETPKGNPVVIGLEQYFKSQDAALLERLRQEKEREKLREELAQTTGIHDEALLDVLLRQGIGPETLEALRVTPLVLVAWADGKLDARERETIQNSAREMGVAPASEGEKLLERWLSTPPDESLFAAWSTFIQATTLHMATSERTAFREHLLSLATRVARASGGFLNLGNRISPEEQRVLQRLRAAFES